MHQPIIGLGDDIIPAYNEVNTPPIKDPEDEEGEVRDLSHSLA